MRPSDEQLLPVKENSATIEGTPSEDLPVQSAQSDSRRGEDYESPEAYSRFLLQESLEQGSEGRALENLQQNSDDEPVKAGRQTMGEAVSELAPVPELVASALKEKEMLKAYLYSSLRG